MARLAEAARTGKATREDLSGSTITISSLGALGGIVSINGFSGHGFQHSPAAGRILADVITGRDPQLDLTPFAAGRFAQLGVAAGERYVV